MGAATTMAERSSTLGDPSAAATAGPPPGPAIDHPPTRAALARRRWWVFGFCGLAAVLAVAFPVLYATTDLWGIPIYGVPLSLIVAGCLERRWRGIRRILSTHPWVARRGLYFVTGGGRFTHVILLVEADRHGPEAVCTVIGPGMSYDILSRRQGPVDVWVAGDPIDRAAATDGGGRFVLIAQPAWGRWRDHLRRRVEVRMSGNRPDLYLPPERDV
jgi:hypothetical protein